MHKMERKEPVIPRFSFKSSLLILLSAVVGSVLIPYVAYEAGVDYRIFAVIANAILISATLTYTRYFIDTKKGFGNWCYKTFAIFATTIGIITYFWLFHGVYM